MASIQVTYRSALPDDAWNIICVHYAAVMAGGRGVYSDEVLRAWSPTPDERRCRRIAELLSRESTVCIIAVSESTTAGFGIALPTEGWIRALYVHPDYWGRGLGRALIGSLEVQCASASLTTLSVNASHNAEGFYRECGYEVVGPTVQQLSDAVAMRSTHMMKRLS